MKQQNVIKIGWDCDNKYIMTPTKIKKQKLWCKQELRSDNQSNKGPCEIFR